MLKIEYTKILIFLVEAFCFTVLLVALSWLLTKNSNLSHKNPVKCYSQVFGTGKNRVQVFLWTILFFIVYYVFQSYYLFDIKMFIFSNEQPFSSLCILNFFTKDSSNIFKRRSFRTFSTAAAKAAAEFASKQALKDSIQNAIWDVPYKAKEIYDSQSSIKTKPLLRFHKPANPIRHKSWLLDEAPTPWGGTPRKPPGIRTDITMSEKMYYSSRHYTTEEISAVANHGGQIIPDRMFNALNKQAGNVGSKFGPYPRQPLNEELENAGVRLPEAYRPKHHKPLSQSFSEKISNSKKKGSSDIFDVFEHFDYGEMALKEIKEKPHYIFFWLILFVVIYCIMYIIVSDYKYSVKSLFIWVYHETIKWNLGDKFNYNFFYYQPYVWYFFGLTLFIFYNNIEGMIPEVTTATAYLQLPIFLTFLGVALSFFVAFEQCKFKMPKSFLPSGLSVIVGPFLYIIEVIFYFMRLFSVTIRLLINILAGHLLLKIFSIAMVEILIGGVIFTEMSFFLMVLTFIFVFLEYLVCFLQAAVLSSLVAIYVAQSSDFYQH